MMHWLDLTPILKVYRRFLIVAQVYLVRPDWKTLDFFVNCLEFQYFTALLEFV